MKQLTLLCLVGLAVVSLVTASAHAHKCTTCPSFKNTDSLAAKNLASLQGCWRGASRDGVPSEVSYELASDGTALLETQWVEGFPPLLTVYYMDGKDLAAHHFCSLGNQVRMRAKASEDGRQVSFRYRDATNLPRGKRTVMIGTSVQFEDQDRITVDWVLDCSGSGGGEITNTFTYQRVVEGCKVGTLKRWSER